VSNDEHELRLAWRGHVATGPAADAWFDAALGRHREPTRHYHGIRHVKWVVHHGRQLAASSTPPLPADQLDQVVAAAFFHDAVYDPAATDNEAASARLAVRALGELGWPADATAHVASMIEATAGHDLTASADLATAVLVAADLGVLAADPARYTEYSRAVRREYAHLDDDTWRAGRASFIRSMLERSTLFPARLDLGEWERHARANLTAELATLE
jgi:predicted metal-dependent HD superfamily phosphohydrolase